MSDEQPPRDPQDTVVDEVIAQVQRALDEAQVSLGPAREQLRAELTAAFRMVGRDLTGRSAPSTPEPELSVVEGGREADAPPTEGPGPELTVAEGTAGEGAPEESERPAGPTPGVRWVMRRASRGGGVGTETSRVPGKLRLTPPSDGDDGWQTLFRAAEPRAYRIHCDAGELEVAIDGLPGERVRSGCSMDLEARLVRVRARPGGSVSARYRRLAVDGEL